MEKSGDAACRVFNLKTQGLRCGRDGQKMFGNDDTVTHIRFLVGSYQSRFHRQRLMQNINTVSTGSTSSPVQENKSLLLRLPLLFLV